MRRFENNLTLVEKIKDQTFSDDEIYHEVSSGLHPDDQSAVVQALQNYRPCLLKQLLCFVEE